MNSKALFAHTGAAYNNLAETTEASKARLATDGPPMLGINRPMALAELVAAEETALMCAVNVSLESSITPRYFAVRLMGTRRPPDKRTGSLYAHLRVSMTASVL